MKVAISDRTAIRLVVGIQTVFFLSSLVGLNGPFLSVHFERQNQTYDIARHVFQTGWQGIIIPEASFSMPGYTNLPFTVSRLEFPFFGLIGWPFVMMAGHDHAVVRLIAVAFSLLSIYLIFRILRHWLDPASALFGTALWAFAPLVLHFGQVPMPDILCTAAVMLAFYLALRGKLAASSMAFAFAILAKESVLSFGLPVLVALLAARNIRTSRAAIRTAVLWGVTPAILIAGWLALDRVGPPTPWTVLHVAKGDARGPLSDFVSPSFYLHGIASLLPFGIGVMGCIALWFAFRNKTVHVDRWMKVSIVFASVFYVVFVVRKILEPQYFLPLLFWLIVATSFGFTSMAEKFSSSRAWRLVLFFACAAHVFGAWIFTSDLKASRVPDLPAITRAALLLPPGTRVAVIYLGYGASPAVWLNRNVQSVSWAPQDLDRDLPAMEAANFRYLMILDVESRHRRRQLQLMSLPVMIETLKLVLTGQKLPDEEADPLTRLANAGSPPRQYCDAHLKRIFESPSAVLYELPAGRT